AHIRLQPSSVYPMLWRIQPGRQDRLRSLIPAIVTAPNVAVTIHAYPGSSRPKHSKSLLNVMLFGAEVIQRFQVPYGVECFFRKLTRHEVRHAKIGEMPEVPFFRQCQAAIDVGC